MRIGSGFDAHRFSLGRKLVLGGVTLSHDMGLIAHSDGDVLIHALCDALLGAAGLGDIGRHFPPSNAEYKGMDSRLFLRRVMEMVRDEKLSVCNADITLIAQEPKLAPDTPEMEIIIAEDLGVDPSRINVKATTTEGMGFTGRAEGIAAHAVVLLSEES